MATHEVSPAIREAAPPLLSSAAHPDAQASKVSRRVFLRGVAASGGAAAVSALLAACGSGAPAATTAAAPTSAATTAAAPTAPVSEATAAPATAQAGVGGTYRFLGEFDVASLDSALAGNFEDWWSCGTLMYSQLYAYDLQGKLFPDAAAAMPTVSSDALEYTIPLRKGVKFHNGREMTAEDVKFTFERILAPETASWGVDYLRGIVGAEDIIAKKTTALAGVTVVDPYTITIKLVKPQAVFLPGLTQTTNGIVPKQEVLAAGKDWGTSVVIGTGPFKFVEWKTGEKLTYGRNPDYFVADTPHLDRIELYVNIKPEVGLLRWENDEADFIWSIPPAELPRLRGDEQYKADFREVASLQLVTINFNALAKPFDLLKVRQAVALGIDKQTLAQKSGIGIVAEGHFAPLMAQYNKDFKSQYQYDPEKAKQLLAEAGFPQGITGVKFFAGQGQELGELMQADLKAIGIEAEVLSGDYEAVKDRFKKGEIAMTMFGFGTGTPDAFEVVNRFACLGPNDKPNPTRLCDQRINDILLKSEVLKADDPARTKMYQEMEDIIINQQVFTIVPYFKELVALSKAKVQGDDLLPIYGLPWLRNARITA